MEGKVQVLELAEHGQTSVSRGGDENGVAQEIGEEVKDDVQEADADVEEKDVEQGLIVVGKERAFGLG